MTKIQQVTITKVNARRIGETIKWNFDLNGRPFGQVWTFKGIRGGFRAKSLNGECKHFDTYKAAETFMRGEM